MKRQVNLNFTLTGKTRASFLAKEFGNRDILESVEDQIKDSFGDARAIFVFDKERVMAAGRLYPDFYAAGWFVSRAPKADTDGKGSELVVIAHGKNMAEAKANMMLAVENSDWETLAKNL